MVVVSGLLLVTVLWFFFGRPDPKANEPKLETATVHPETLSLKVASTGRVVPNREIEIKAKASGKVIVLPFEVSDVVHKGDLLVELDPVDELPSVKQAEASLSQTVNKLDQARLNLRLSQEILQTNQDRARASLASAKAKAEDAKLKSDRLKQLLDRQFISRDEYDSAMTSAVQAAADYNNARVRFDELKTDRAALLIRQEDIQISKTQVDAAKITLGNAVQRLNDTRIYAPIDGVVATRNIQIGTIISSGISNVGGGTTALTLADLSRIFIIASVDESDIGTIREGQPARITVDSFPGEHFTGRVVQIATKGVNLTNVVTFDVKMEVLSENRFKLKPEMTANVEIITQQKNDALVVPVSAVTYKPAKGNVDQPMVTILGPSGSKNEQIKRPVTLGMVTPEYIEILQGVAPGEKVVLSEDEMSSKWRKEKGGKGKSKGREMQRGMMMMGGGRRGGGG